MTGASRRKSSRASRSELSRPHRDPDRGLKEGEGARWESHAERRHAGTARPSSAGQIGKTRGNVVVGRDKLHNDAERCHFHKCQHFDKRHGQCSAQVKGDARFCKNHAPPQWCSQPGCGAPAEGLDGKCEKHKPRPICSHEGCNKEVVAVHGRLCKLHIGARQCSHRNCENPAEGNSGRCKMHPLGSTQLNPNKIVRVDFCKHSGCNNYPEDGDELCREHRKRPPRPLDWDRVHHGVRVGNLGEGGAPSKEANDKHFCKHKGCGSVVSTAGMLCAKHEVRRDHPLSWTRMHNQQPDTDGVRKAVRPQKDVCDIKRWCSHRHCDRPAKYCDNEVVTCKGEAEARWLCEIHAPVEHASSPFRRCSHVSEHGRRCTERADFKHAGLCVGKALCRKHAPIAKDNIQPKPVQYFQVGKRGTSKFDSFQACSVTQCDAPASKDTGLCKYHSKKKAPHIRRGHNVAVRIVHEIEERDRKWNEVLRTSGGIRNYSQLTKPEQRELMDLDSTGPKRPLVQGPHHGAGFDKGVRWGPGSFGFNKDAKQDAGE